jgi:hypothetical protein
MKWIKCSQEYPNVWVDVLIYDGVDIRVAHFRDDAWIDSHMYIHEEITHWMPLPEVPNE